MSRRTRVEIIRCPKLIEITLNYHAIVTNCNKTIRTTTSADISCDQLIRKSMRAVVRVRGSSLFELFAQIGTNSQGAGARSLRGPGEWGEWHTHTRALRARARLAPIGAIAGAILKNRVVVHWGHWPPISRALKRKFLLEFLKKLPSSK